MILDALQLDPNELERRTGWSIKPEGACKGDRCVPLPASRDAHADVRALAERLYMPLIHDTASGLWCLGPESGGPAWAEQVWTKGLKHTCIIELPSRGVRGFWVRSDDPTWDRIISKCAGGTGDEVAERVGTLETTIIAAEGDEDDDEDEDARSAPPMSFIMSVGRSDGWYRSCTRPAWCICLGPVAVTLVFGNIDAVFDTALTAKEAHRGSTHLEYGGFCLCDTKSHPESERVEPLPASVQAGSQPQVRRW